MRDKFQTRNIRLVGELQRQTLLNLIQNLPADSAKPLEIVIREEQKPRKPDQNALYWVGPLAAIAEQGYIKGRAYSADVWHHHFKEEYLPEEDNHELHRLVKNCETYRKWGYTPKGDRILIGSTTDLTVYGFSLYLEQVMAFGAGLGVMFSESRKSA